MNKTANKEKIIIENNRKLIKVDTVSIPCGIEGKEFRQKYIEIKEMEKKKKKFNW